MAAGKYNTTIRQGDTWTETFTVVANLLTGYLVVMKWKNSAGTVVVTCSSGATPSTMTIAVGAVNTVLSPIVTSAQTALLPAGRYRYTLQLTSPGGIVSTPVEGIITVTGDAPLITP
jgi:hypothetical protein